MDCNTEYRTATLFGIEFEILDSDHSGGRRVLSHEYPFQDDHYNEDLGDKPLKWSIKGAFTGETFRDRLAEAKALWRREGFGEFFEPTENRTYEIVIVDWSISLENKKLNYVEFNLEVVERGLEPYLSLGNAGRFTSQNTFEKYMDGVEVYYSKIIGEFVDFAKAFTSYGGAKDFINKLARQYMGAGAYLNVIRAIASSGPSRTVQPALQSATAIFEEVASSTPALGTATRSNQINSNLGFFRSASELRMTGSIEVEGQAAMFALVGLGYYFDEISEQATPAEVTKFRERAIALKAIVGDADMSNRIDDLITAIGLSADIECQKLIGGVHNALVASYKIYGNVSQAYDILQRSSGVSGASMNEIIVPCQDL